MGEHGAEAERDGEDETEKENETGTLTDEGEEDEDGEGAEGPGDGERSPTDADAGRGANVEGEELGAGEEVGERWGGWTEGKRMMREGSAGEGVELLRQLVREFSVRTLAEKTRRSTFDW